MSICGILAQEPPADLDARLAAMLAPLECCGERRVERRADPHSGGALGRAALAWLDGAQQPAMADGGQLCAVLDGELYEATDVAERLRKEGIDVDPAQPAAILLELYRRGDRRGIAALHGSFAAAILDTRSRRLTLVSDRFGTRPMYYAHVPGRFLCASSIKALTADPAVSREASRRGLAQFFTFGHYLRDATSLEAVRVVPAAGWLVYEADADRLAVERYWQLSDVLSHGSRHGGDWLEAIDSAFERAVERRLDGSGQLGLSLSGGLDARTILGVIDERHTNLKTVCLGMAGSLDHRSAERLARQVGCAHHNHVLGEGFLDRFREHLEQMVRLTDGQYLSQCIVMPTLPLYHELGIQVLLRGHAGELMHMQKAYNYSLDREALEASDLAALEAWLFRRLQAYLLDGLDEPLFQGNFQTDAACLALESLREDLAETVDLQPPVQRIWQLFVTQRLRRETTLSLVKFRSVVETRLPYLDNDLVTLLLSAPPGLKLSDRIQMHILRRRRPEFLAVVNANTGARLGAARWEQKMATLQMKVLGKLGVPGYQPYERLGLWLRRELAPTVREILLSDRCLERGTFSADGLRHVVDAHLSGRRNHTFLLLALMIHEMGQRHLEG